MATYVVGDIHGCDRARRELLEHCGFDAGRDRLWLAGDLVNRGPRSLEVLRWARDLSSRLGERMVAVLGNHDLHLLSRHAGLRPARPRDTFDAVMAAPDADDLVAWLANRPLVHRDGDNLLVHAGLLPSWTPADAERRARQAEAFLRDVDRRPEMLARSGSWDDATRRSRAALQTFTRLRTCTVEGQPCNFAGPPEAAPEGCLPWFRVPGRKSAGIRVLCGHWSTLGLHREANIVALDSGAAWGGSLSALRLEDERIFQVPVTETSPPV